jgi:large subunit ribosomal protein L2
VEGPPGQEADRGQGRQRRGATTPARITIRHHGGGHKQLYRLVDFRRRKFDVAATWSASSTTPIATRSSRWSSIPTASSPTSSHPSASRSGEQVVAGERVDIKPGNALPLRNIPVGTIIHNIELKPGRGGQMARSAGAFVQLVGKDQGFALLRLPRASCAACRRVHGPRSARCRTRCGERQIGKAWPATAGRAGARHVRGTAMNPIDHPHGGGEGPHQGRPSSVNAVGPGRPKGYKTRPQQVDGQVIVRRPLEVTEARPWHVQPGSGPFVDGLLLKKAEKSRELQAQRVSSRSGRAARPSCRSSSASPSGLQTGTSFCPCW